MIQANLPIDRHNLLPAETERYLPLEVKWHVLTAAIVSGALSGRKSQASVAVTDGHSLALCVLAFNNTVCTKWNAAPCSSVRIRRLRPICGVFVVAARDLGSFLGAFEWSRNALRSCVLSVRFLSVCPQEPTRLPLDVFPWNLIVGGGTFMDICRGNPNLVKIRWQYRALDRKT